MDVAPFHASGAGGSAMEQLIAAGKVAVVLEPTPHELTAEVVGTGWYQPVPSGRLAAAGRAGIATGTFGIARGNDKRIYFIEYPNISSIPGFS